MYPKFRTNQEWHKHLKQLRAEGVQVINNLFQVEMMRDKLLKKEDDTFYISTLIISDNGDVVQDYMPIVGNRQSKLVPLIENWPTYDNLGVPKTLRLYSRALLNVEVQGEDAFMLLMQPILRIEDTFYSKDSEGYYEMVSKKRVDNMFYDDTGKLKLGVLEYNNYTLGGMTCTSGQLKQHNLTLVAFPLENFDVIKQWNIVTYGAVGIMCDNSEGTPKDLAQANTRFSAFKAPSVPVGKIGTFAVYMGKLTFGMQKDTGEYRDGFAMLSSEFCGEKFTEAHPGFFFTPWAFEGGLIQERAWTNKVLAEVFRSKYISEFISHWGLETVILQRGAINATEAKNFIDGVKSKGKDGDYAGKVVIIVDNPADAWNIDLFTDLNGLKAPFDPNTDSCLEALDISHTEHDIENGSNISTQLFQSLMIQNPAKAMDIMVEHGQALINSKREVLYADKGKAPSWMDFQGGVDYQRMVGSVLPKFAREMYAPFWRSICNNHYKGIISSIRRLNLPTRGAHTFLISDTAADFGVNILGMQNDGIVEIIAPLASECDISRCVGVKYPKQGHLEFLKAKVIAPEEYITRVQECLSLTDEQKELIISHVSHLSGAVTMIPAFEHLKNMMAGADFDGDSIQLFFNEEIVSLMWEMVPVAVIIDEEDVEEEDAYLDMMEE